MNNESGVITQYKNNFNRYVDTNIAETIKATINMLTDSRQEFIKGAQKKKNAIKITLEAKKETLFWVLVPYSLNCQCNVTLKQSNIRKR